MSNGAPTHSIDRLAAEQLRRKLSAASTRVFDCVRLHQAALKAGATPDQFMFHKPDLNRIIYIKEPFLDEAMADAAGRPVGTKLYFAYNEQDAYEGGRSIFFSDKTLRNALHFQAGITPDDHSAAFTRDLTLLRAFEDLPSLDPFLLKDRLNAEGMSVHDSYLEISDGEFTEIRDFVMARFRPMVEMAFEGLSHAETLTRLRALVEKLWEAKDMEGLGPILQAMQLKAEDGPAAFYAWKGVIYYDYLRSSQRERWKDYASFLGHDAVPTDLVPKENREDLDGLVAMARSLFKQRWMQIEKILTDYNRAYDQLFKEQSSPGPFIEFLRASPNHFYSLGDCISSIDHAIEVWNGFKQSRVLRRMKYERLYPLMGLTIRILE
ncbi:MAG: hypothetical protein O3B74_10155 [Proteobacteria bacterium]|nr:hypothetical protein [Pseudomonadota bacterium]MDA1310011.1 hypothetical protein [Pseudomonadota bacterium]